MNVALLDLNHFTRGVTNNTVPLGLGMIAAFLRKRIGGALDIRIFKDTSKALGVFASWTPDVIGLAQYVWNSELNLSVARIVKDRNPRCFVVVGGPNLDLSAARRMQYFIDHPLVDAGILYDGEIPFAGLVGRLMAGESRESICLTPSAGMYSFDRKENALRESAEPPPRLSSLDEIGAIYAEGVFDEFLNVGCHPFLQTHRGCPFTCTFCHTSDSYYSRMLFLSPEIFRREMECLGKRYAGRHDVTLFLANTNMSLFPEDFTIAGIIRETQEKYDWPRNISVNSGKDPKKLLAMMDILRFQPSIALQTLTPAVLKNIKRINIPFDNFVSFQRAVLKETGAPSVTELILCLPGETRASFLETLCRVLNSGVQSVVIYTLMSLKGTELVSEESIRKYRFDIRHRVVPRQFSVVSGRKVLDTEAVVVATDTMSFGDYLELRGLCFTVTTFYSSLELMPIKKLLLESGVDVSAWVLGIHARCAQFPDLAYYHDEFIKETQAELFLTREALTDFFEDPRHWEDLCQGLYGDNLTRKYKQLVLTKCYKTLLEVALSEARDLLAAKLLPDMLEDLLRDLRSYLSVRDVRDIFEGTLSLEDRVVTVAYNIPLWMMNSNPALGMNDFRGRTSYRVIYPVDIKEKAQEFARSNKDKELSLQIMYRDGLISDFWPRWIESK
ncbi:MAG: radical SAM protein [Candidatus Omnitrophica bacterium]|nr:radical SAM protein [Candidatus Omnitrophota bacterium]